MIGCGGGGESSSEDVDGDGYTVAQGDCDDADPTVNPGADEVCNGQDDNCDGDIDEGAIKEFYADADGDGYGVDDAATNETGCTAPVGYADEAGDCDDADPALHPGAEELCDEVDNDCNGAVDDGAGSTFYYDGDGDSYGVDDAATNVKGCTPPMGYVAVAGDCDDDDPQAFPANPELCDGVDNDCNGTVDEGVALNTYYQDGDGDGYGNDASTQTGCVTPTTGSWVLEGGDCDDSDPVKFPGNPEVCDGKDNDCDAGTPDPGAMTWYPDADGDGYGSTTGSQVSCAAPAAGWTLVGGDCNDGDAAINPAAIELCDGIDNNCVNGIDEGPVPTYVDVDGDGYGDQTAAAVYLCEVKAGTSADNTDCNDANAEINPGAAEIPGNGTDENCDGNDTAAGTLCGHDTLSVTTLPYNYNGSLTTTDQSTGGPKGAGFYWDDIEISTTAGQVFTILYASMDPAAMRPVLYTYGPNSCTTLIGSDNGAAGGSPKGSYLATRTITNAAAGYYSTALTTYAAGQTGSYKYAVLPGNVRGSCGGDTGIIWPLGWRKAGSLSAADIEPAGTPVTSGYYSDDFEFYLTAGHTYTLLLGGVNYNEKIILAKAGACGTAIATSTSGISNGGSALTYTPTESGIYVAYVTSSSAGVTGSYVFNVVEGTLGSTCFTGDGTYGGTGDSYVLYPLGGATTNSLAIGDRAGDWGQRYFDDYETYLEKGDVIAVTMTRTTGTFRPRIYLSSGSACATSVASATAGVGGDTVTLNYTATSSGIYALSFTSYETSAAGSYSITTSVN